MSAPVSSPQRRCTCRHIAGTHQLVRKARTACSASGCDCKLFVSAKAVNGG